MLKTRLFLQLLKPQKNLLLLNYWNHHQVRLFELLVRCLSMENDNKTNQQAKVKLVVLYSF